MVKPLTVRFRLYLLLGALVLTNLAGALSTVWYTGRIQSLYTDMLDHDMSALSAAQELLSALSMQKGFVTYYFLSGDDAWLERLQERHVAFEGWLARMRSLEDSARGRAILSQIESEYLRYTFERNKVVALYREGARERGAKLHWDVRDRFYAIFSLCEDHKKLHEENIRRTRAEYRRKERVFTALAFGAVPASVMLAVFLGLLVLRQVLEPIRRLALVSGATSAPAPVGVELRALTERVQALLQDVDQVQSELRESREHLVQTEKLAVVGKLAAGVAHSIRNPLTSVKMRLFTLERTLRLDPAQKEDFEVIAEEIRQIDIIVKNFLEFSRPPRLKLKAVSPSDIVDLTTQLLRHKLDSFGVDVRVEREGRLGEIMADPEQIKEVLVNIILNACEAMGVGGRIVIREEEGIMEPQGSVAIIRIEDTGPGVPHALRKSIFEPFFSTKEEGSGLGLSIAARIMGEHGGWLHLVSSEGRGAAFVLAFPAREEGSWHRS